MRPLLVFILMTMATIPAVAAQVPVTDRHQDMTYTSYEVNAFAAAAYHRIVNKQRKAGLIDRDRSEVARVRRIAARLIIQAKRIKYRCNFWHWEVHVSDAPDVDASSMAGGKILIGSRFIRRYSLTDAELAMVLAHEIAHALAEHVREQLSEVQLRHPRYPYSVQDASVEMGSNIAVYLSLMPLFERQETEADHIGVYLVAAAGYSPDGALGFYRKLVRRDGGHGDPGMFATHTTPTARLHAVEGFIKELGFERSAAADLAGSLAEFDPQAPATR
ncbi:MAG: M48 family metallopeptidase [Gammaproteobacteria bacterium]